MKLPEKTEFADFYSGYVSLVPEADVLSVLDGQPDELRVLMNAISDEKGLFAYAEGKWTIKEVVGHLIDGERVFAYRAHRFSHGDPTPLSGFDQNTYIANGRSNDRLLQDLFDEFGSQRRSNILMLKSLREADWDLRGTASGAEVSVRALAFIMAGHVRHHLKILAERYLS